MCDSLEERNENKVKHSKHEIVTSFKNENDCEKKPIVQTASDEKIEKLHERIDSKHCVEPNQSIKTDENIEKTEKIPVIVEEENKNVQEPIKNNEEKSKNANKMEKPQEKSRISDSVLYDVKESKEKIIRNQSDIFSLKDVPTTLQTSIFSVNGCPSRRVFRKQEPAGHVFQRNEDPPADKIAAPIGNRITKENYNDEKRPSSSYRNPLTGSGLSSNDEYKSKGIKRKDGNPLLGLGYDSEVTSVISQHRIPPGGYSHKLW